MNIILNALRHGIHIKECKTVYTFQTWCAESIEKDDEPMVQKLNDILKTINRSDGGKNADYEELIEIMDLYLREKLAKSLLKNLLGCTK